jgi:non-ribosomal peptide synthetase component E (peptide arylation enzyme)
MTVFDPAYFRVQGWWRDETLSDWLDRCVSTAPERAALLCADRTLTYAAFAADVASLAAGLADISIGRGDVVS